MNVVLVIVVKTTLILCCASVMTFVMRRASASARHAIWVLGLAAIVAMPLISVVMPTLDLPILQPEKPVEANSVVVSSSVEPTNAAEVVTAKHSTSSSEFTRTMPVADTVQPSNPSLWLAFVWGTGALVVLLRWLGSVRDLRRLKRSSIPVVDASYIQLLFELKRELNIRTAVKLRLGEDGLPPMTWGLFRPVILVPASATEWTLDTRRAVLAHELAHVKHRDGLVWGLTQIARLVYWFNPLVWYAAYRLESERERACDDCVIRLGADAVDYADCLVAIARGVNSSVAVALSMARQSQLKSRLEAILDPRTRRLRLSRRCKTLLLTGSATMAGLIAVVQLTPIQAIEAYMPVLSPVPPVVFAGQREALAPRQVAATLVGEVSETSAQVIAVQARPSSGTTLDNVRQALNQAAGALASATPGTQIGRDGRATAMTAVANALRDVESAIVFAAQNPLQAAEPPAPSLERPDFTVPVGMEARGPSQRAALSALRFAFDLLAAAPGGDLGGSRIRINAEIATASKAIIAGLAAAASSPAPEPTSTERSLTPFIQVLQGRAPSKSGKPLEGVRDALIKAANALAAATPGTQTGRDGRTTAMTAVATALGEVESAIVFAAQNPLQAAEPPAPSTSRPDFAVPAGMEVRGPSERALSALRLAFDLLAAAPGGDLGGTRARINVEIGTASNAIISGLSAAASSPAPNSQVTPIIQASPGRAPSNSGTPLDGVRDALVKAANALAAATPGTQTGRDGRTTAMTAVANAVRDVESAIVFAAQNPLQAAEPPGPSPARPDFAVPAGMEARGPSQRAALSALQLAFDLLAAAPGGDFGGTRARINVEIGTASNAIIAGLAAAAAEVPQPSQRPRGIQ